GVPTSSLTITSSPVCVNSSFNVAVTNAESVNFDFGIDPNNPTWHFANDNMDYTYTDNFSTPAPNNFRTITAKVKLQGCDAETTMTAPIVIDPAPFGTTTHHYYNCGAFSTTLTYTQLPSPPSAAVSYQWYYNGTAMAAPNGTSNPVTVNQYGWYWVVVTAANGCTWTSDSIPVLEVCPCNLATNSPHQPWSPTVTISQPTITNCNEINLTANIPSSPPLTPGLISYNWKAIQNAHNITSWPNYSTTSATAVAKEAGSYLFEYEVFYEDTFGTVCSYKATQWALVPYKAKYQVWHTCADSAGWRYTYIQNASDVFSYLTFREISIDGNVVTNAGIWSGYLSPGNHTIKLRIADATHDTCEVEGTYLVQWPNADFDWDRPISCEKEATVQFNNLSTGGSPVLWDFDDGAQNKQYDPYRVFDNPGIYEVTLWIQDSWGCRDSITKEVEIVQDEIEGRISAAPTSVCQGQPITLRYIPDLGTNFPANYTWYNQLDVIANTTYQPLTVYESGYYWAYVEDANYGCYDNTAPVVVNVTKVPQAFITGDSVQCQDVPYTLSGYAGSDPGISYQWLRGGTPITGATGPTLTDVQSTPLTSYPYQVIVTVTGPGGTCSDTSDVFTVDIYPTPGTPNPTFNILDCDLYQVELSVVPTNPGTYNWSNGLFGSPAYSYSGGSYQVTYTDLNGCQSKATMYVPEDPRMHLWVFPTGCFTICPQNAYTITGNYIWSFSNWDYRKAGSGSVHNGTGLMFPDYTNLNNDAPGTFNLTLDNGWCSATSGNMYVDTSCEPRGHIKPGRPSENGSVQGRGLLQWNNEPDALVGMNIVPNPAKQNARIDYVFNEQSTLRYIEVYDITGRILSRHKAEEVNGSWHLSLEQYTSGIYQVVLKQDGKVLLQSRMSVVR
ncbi:MAG: T9SS type A sorting domain-containing protein, partial [Taibaiella sp.]|nr:T9SS type A sorting domain-containing protein [Taibaiella sp.]